jgi:hypothetical protein
MRVPARYITNTSQLPLFSIFDPNTNVKVIVERKRLWRAPYACLVSLRADGMAVEARTERTPPARMREGPARDEQA